MPELIYLVKNLGDYDEQDTLVAAFGNRERAEKAKRDFQCDLIEVVELDPPQPHPDGFLPFHFWIDADGNASTEPVPGWGCGRCGDMRHSLTVVPPQTKKDRSFPRDDPRRHKIVRPELVCFYVWGRDEAHALQYAMQQHATLLRDGLWPHKIEQWPNFGWTPEEHERIAKICPRPTFCWPEAKELT